MVVIKKVGILSLAKIQAILMAIFGLILGIFYAVFASLLNSAEYVEETAIAFGWWTILVFPIIYGVIGFITGIIGGALYNLVAKWIGGIELDIKK